jgi:hypothetical protein
MGEVNGIESWHIKKFGNGVTYGLSKTFFAKMERAVKIFMVPGNIIACFYYL